MANGAQIEPPLDSLITRTWDVAVIGAGLGGATLGYDLARRGHSVLFIERGPAHSRALNPEFRYGIDITPPDNGWWPADLSHYDGSAVQTFRHPLGCGTGGSSAIFGMVMERFRPQDFEPRRFLPDAGQSTIPDSWPISYADLEKYYGDAERLYRVRGTPDPLFPGTPPLLAPPPATSKELLLLEALTESGLHPYRFHYACERVPECNSCVGTLCARSCRNDAHRLCIVPAVEEFGAGLLSNCRVQRLECPNRKVTEVIGLHRGIEVKIKARIIVLAANTFSSPLILLRSRSKRFPKGLANGSGMVGKNLMLHVSDSLLVKRRGLSTSRLRSLGSPINHGIGINDFYHIDGIKHGNIHAHPVSVSRGSVESYLRLKYPRRAKQFPAAIAIASCIGAGIHAEKTYFATIVEDLPYAENRILPDRSVDDRMAYSYTIHDELRKRATNLVRMFAGAIDSRCSVSVLGPQCQLNRSHACGTLRFGRDPRTSVLDPTNRAHEVDNLYVVDASFFPSSGGMNPGLTIAANALRVAEIIANRL
jgi:choline dehydrogenase-like flavoprotein